MGSIIDRISALYEAMESQQFQEYGFGGDRDRALICVSHDLDRVLICADALSSHSVDHAAYSAQLHHTGQVDLYTDHMRESDRALGYFERNACAACQDLNMICVVYGADPICDCDATDPIAVSKFSAQFAAETADNGLDLQQQTDTPFEKQHVLSESPTPASALMHFLEQHVDRSWHSVSIQVDDITDRSGPDSNPSDSY